MRSRWTNRAPLLLLLISTGGCGGCDPLGLSQVTADLRNAVDTLDRAVDTLALESADWQVVLAGLESQLVDDLRSTLRAEATDLMRNGVHGAGVELRCSSEYLARRAAAELIRIRNDFARELNELAERTGEPPIELRPEPVREPFICSSVPSAVDLNLAADRRTKLDVYGFDLRSAPISAEVVTTGGVRRGVTQSLGILGDFQMVLDLTDGGAAPKVPDARVVFGWLKRSQSVVPILAAARDRTCTTRTTVVPGVPQTITPAHNRGDQDFDGNGPCVRLTGQLDLDAERTALTATISMTARECNEDGGREGDSTTAAGTVTVEVFRVPDPGSRIVSFDLAPAFLDTYRDTNHQDDLRTFAGTQMFEKIRYVGDTRGDESGTRTGAEAFFRRLELQVEQCTEPSDG